MSGARERELGFWWALTESLGDDAIQQRMGELMRPVVDALDLPRVLLEPGGSLRQVLRAEPGLRPLLRLDAEEVVHDEPTTDPEARKRELLYLRAVVDVFGGQLPEQVSAEQYTGWLADVRLFEEASGLGRSQQFAGRGSGTGGGLPVTEAEVADAVSELKKGRGLLSAPEIEAGLRTIEKRHLDRMALAEVLKDAKLAKTLQPSMAMVEQLLRQKDGLSGQALVHAKAIIRRFIDELRDVLARDVASTPRGKPDRSTPPRRSFRNLDLKRTLWRNLVNWDPKQGRLFVDRLYYRQRAKQVDRHRMIVVVDQSGSMVPAMVNCTILASIFAGLPKVECALIAYDTTAVDLTPWVADPFEVLLRTKLGGGTDGTCALPHVAGHLVDPRRTVVAWISDFYDNRELMPAFTALVRSGVRFLPIGAVSTSGYFSVDAWFRDELKALGTPVLSGSLRSLVRELKAALA